MGQNTGININTFIKKEKAVKTYQPEQDTSTTNSMATLLA